MPVHDNCGVVTKESIPSSGCAKGLCKALMGAAMGSSFLGDDPLLHIG